MGQAISKLTIKGYKSIRNLENFELRKNLNILIGPNGAGKSNFLSFFTLFRATLSENSKGEMDKLGKANRLFYMGSKVTKTCEFKVRSEGGVTGFSFSRCLIADPEDSLILNPEYSGMDSGEYPSAQDGQKYLDNAKKIFQKNIRLYHFHDTSTLAGVKKYCSIRDYEYLFADASNLAAFLWYLKKKHEKEYKIIREVTQLAVPFFDDFLLRESIKDPDETLLEWRQKGSDYSFHPNQISDGTLRFICLATAMLQPDPPSTILLDEPELGLHPYALTLLAGLIQKASIKTQIIVATQSAALIDHFQPEDIVVVERQDAESIFKRLTKEELKVWLDDYSLGDLWQMNVIGGRPAGE